jgi:hypothetical protein
VVADSIKAASRRVTLSIEKFLRSVAARQSTFLSVQKYWKFFNQIISEEISIEDQGDLS